jgi:hypothetical protein
MRFGIGMNKDHTLEEFGRQFSVTRECIRSADHRNVRFLDDLQSKYSSFESESNPNSGAGAKKTRLLFLRRRAAAHERTGSTT